MMSGVTQHQCARPHFREGYNYYISCYLGNITVEERYGNILRCCLGNRLYSFILDRTRDVKEEGHQLDEPRLQLINQPPMC